ncbi:transposase [Desulfosarcina sp. OttesenSCG-928-G10]|nr:transposase [Desulfosarcina sp. OttesenSCG-928-G10]MDL2322322.1 transposase [Desulfosarcina sp. OttesenSCG-928-B08]
MRYPEERKSSVLKKMMSPHNQSLAQLAAQEGISKATLYNWHKEARSKGILMPDGDMSPAGWTARDKFAVSSIVVFFLSPGGLVGEKVDSVTSPFSPVVFWG